VRDLGLDQVALRAAGFVFAVRRLEAEYLRPAVFDDVLEVRTGALAVTGARLRLAQSVWRGAQEVFRAQVLLVGLTPDGRAARLPGAVRAAFTQT
jgi:acyl-CoA thioester hydrolase